MQPRKNRGDIRDAMVSSPQSRDRLGERKSKDNKVSTYMWKRKARKEEK